MGWRGLGLGSGLALTLPADPGDLRSLTFPIKQMDYAICKGLKKKKRLYIVYLFTYLTTLGLSCGMKAAYLLLIQDLVPRPGTGPRPPVLGAESYPLCHKETPARAFLTLVIPELGASLVA